STGDRSQGTSRRHPTRLFRHCAAATAPQSPCVASDQESPVLHSQGLVAPRRALPRRLLNSLPTPLGAVRCVAQPLVAADNTRAFARVLPLNSYAVRRHGNRPLPPTIAKEGCQTVERALIALNACSAFLTAALIIWLSDTHGADAFSLLMVAWAIVPYGLL